ncbi:Hsp20/alpha crystallin family protein [Metabacillus halosaccharovorans]|uniref:Hsp20/alpha crystallin family protein n=1 Tax=Metabacillus halosaccharovorans TaxID=930124 RepID=A0ABT3DNC2_9BACI|nr:Hsp20/alpha crystallin family protein [Metabacillus halosaccharovorans]MCV9888399.1 Hsp20/alpha crystallin family protein [Metabacillus halosaccharovorans]
MRKKNELTNNKQDPQNEQIDFFQIVDHFFRSEPIRQFMNEFDSMFEGSFPQKSIHVNTYETDQTCVIDMQIPPVKKEQIKLELIDQYLTISITNREEIKEYNENSSTFRSYSSLDSLSKTIVLPYKVEEHEIKTKYKNGSLLVTIPKKSTQILLEDDSI